ncbi:MAG TPA: DUF202 domain-containing protein [Salinisphaeraceae bacterium]|nr:DUF202 domain-containing protein [Salinisphaeraceae bacterium]
MSRRNRETAEEREPDYRFTLANERTFLSWIRTALALLAAAVAITQFLPDFGTPYLRKTVAALLALLSIAAVLGSALRWEASQRAMRREAALPRTAMPWLLALGVIAIGMLVIALTLVYGSR